MREIKFRAWDPIQGKMYEVQSVDFFWGLVELQWWAPNSEGTETHKHRTASIPGEVCAVDDDLVGIMYPILMQYTGLEDKNGTEIYEGDIVRLPKVYDGKGDIATFEFRAPNYFLQGRKGKYEIGDSQDPNCYEVIGNIYENHELLEASRC